MTLSDASNFNKKKYVQQIEFNLFGVLIYYTVCILRYSRRFDGKICDLVDSESVSSFPLVSLKLRLLPHYLAVFKVRRILSAAKI